MQHLLDFTLTFLFQMVKDVGAVAFILVIAAFSVGLITRHFQGLQSKADLKEIQYQDQIKELTRHVREQDAKMLQISLDAEKTLRESNDELQKKLRENEILLRELLYKGESHA